MALSAYDLLWEISQHEIGNIDEIFTTKDLKNRFKKMSFDEFTNDLLEERREELDDIKQEAIELIEIIVENERMAESEMENYNSSTLANVQRILAQLN